MISFVEWLLDLEDIRLARDAPLLLEWGNRLPAWVLFCLALAALCCIGLVYRREQASAGRRLVLAGLRCAVVALVIVVVCQPVLVLQRDRTEKSHVALVLDASQSMAIRESYHDESSARGIARGAGVDEAARLADHPRLELVKAALLRDESAALRQLLSRHAVLLSTFAGTVETIGWGKSPEALGTIIDLIQGVRGEGTSTDLAGAIDQAIEQAQGRHLAAIVLATDGQSTEPTSLKDALDLARGRQIPVFPLRIGSPHRRWDIEVGPLRAEESVFANDFLAIEARLAARGLTEPITVSVVLVDERTGESVAVRKVTLDPAQPAVAVELQTKPAQTGRVRYRVEVAPLPGEYVAENNADHVDVAVLDSRLRVLYVEGYPRYEYRYIKNALLREETVQLSVLLIEADERFVQEGTEPIRRFPETPEELNRYDVVLFGDVDPQGGWLTASQMNMLLDFVANHGGGFGLIAGERAAPHQFLGTPLAKLIPVRIDPEFLGRYEASLSNGFHPELTPEGRRSRLFRRTPTITGLDADRDSEADLFGSLPELFWIARTLGVKPGASALAEHPTARTRLVAASGSGRLPLVVVGRYGAGKILFQATDDTWRWRRHTGELLHDTYWVQVTRELMRGDRMERDRRYVIRTDRRVYPYGVPVQAQIEILDTELLAGRPESIELTVTEQGGAQVDGSAGGGQGGGPGPYALARFHVHRLSSVSNLLEGTYVPPHPGSFTIHAADMAPRAGERVPAVAVRVDPPDLELRRPEADHAVLERIADSTGGRVIDLDNLETEFGAIRDRSVRIPDDLTEPLWDSRLALLLFVCLISGEWVLRKAFGLL